MMVSTDPNRQDIGHAANIRMSAALSALILSFGDPH